MSYTLFEQKRKTDFSIFPGTQGEGPVTLDQVKMTQGHMTLTLDSRKNK